jgi:phage shock protein PspC (stress-responsive transcriptional regulator)
MKKLFRSKNDKILGGVCGGIAQTYGWDATLIRLAWAFISLFSIGIGILLYIVAVIIIPKDPGYTDI